VQHKHGVNYIRYWFDEGTGKVFCLVEAPSKEVRDAIIATGMEDGLQDALDLLDGLARSMS